MNEFNLGFCNRYVAMAAGYAWDSKVKESWGAGTVSSTGSTAGGLVGYAWGGDVINSWADVNVSNSVEQT